MRAPLVNVAIGGALVALGACDSSAPMNHAPDAAPASSPDAPAVIDTSPLEIQALGVSGFVLRRGGDSVLTAPLFTRQSAIEVALNLPLAPDTAAIDAGMSAVAMDDIRAVISGHAHYDHFMDVPHILTKAPSARAYTNLSGRHMLAALAPDRPGCANAAPPATMIARERVIAVDDELASYVDYTNCPSMKPAGAPLAGRWIDVPGASVRLMPVCAMHPAQIGPYHFGEGSVDHDQCELPRSAAAWLEGLTVAFVIDFLDVHGAPAFRVFYQDAPTDAPIGHVPDALIAEKRVDVALLCVGSTDSVDDHPRALLANIQPRFALSSHWEDFFAEAGPMPQPIPLLDLDGYVQRVESALPASPDVPIIVDGEPQTGRHVLVLPGSRFEVPLAP